MANLSKCGIKTWSVDYQQEHTSFNLLYYSHAPFSKILPLSRYIDLEYESIEYSYNWKSGKDSCISKNNCFSTVYIHLNAVYFRLGMLQFTQYLVVWVTPACLAHNFGDQTFGLVQLSSISAGLDLIHSCVGNHPAVDGSTFMFGTLLSADSVVAIVHFMNPVFLIIE